MNIKSLNKDQKKALKLLLNTKKNIFLTGFAGTGKSYVIKLYRSIKESLKEPVPIVASTGAAAVLVNGVTFNSFFGLGIMKGGVDQTIETAIKNYSLCEKLIYTDTVIVDEISMISGETLRAANALCQKIRQNKSFFGGIRMIFVGDFLQLGPFTEGDKKDWCFDSKDWKSGKIEKVELGQIMRTTDKKFIEVLSKIRVGKVDAKVKKFLDSKKLKESIDSFDGTIIFSNNKDVELYNQKKLDLIKNPLITLKTDFIGDEFSINKLKDSLIIKETIHIKKDSLIMFRVNNFNEGYINGTLAYVLGINGSLLVVKTLDGKILKVQKHIFEQCDGNGNVVAKARNFPITLAWAITVHKSQGASIDRAVIDLSNFWLHGQAYTAISRLKSSAGLFISKWNKKSFVVDKNVLKFTKSKK